MGNTFWISVFLLSVFAPLAGAQHAGPNPPCSIYFAVLQDDPQAPGRYVARMTVSQMDWYNKNGRQFAPGLCFSWEKSQYLIVWSLSTQTRTFNETGELTARAETTTNSRENGTFTTYGSLSTWGSYSGTSSGS